MKRTPLFNPEGDDRTFNQKMINGDSTGIANVNESLYSLFDGLYDKMRENFWTHKTISMAPDKVTINHLTDDELKAHLDTLGFLVALDSFAVANLPNIMGFITAPNAKLCIAEQVSQEALHTQSYQYISEETLTVEQRKSIYRRWEQNPLLAKRIVFLKKIGEEFINNPTEVNFVKICAANLALESVFFYQGFNYYDQLASRKKLVSTQKNINYIRKDELTHIHIFKNILKIVKKENPEIPVDQIIINTIKETAKQEIEWGHHIYGDKILGISLQTTEDYVYYLCNKRLKEMGITDNSIFPQRENPYKHLDEHQNESGTGKKSNFFEGYVDNYDSEEGISDWDDF